MAGQGSRTLKLSILGDVDNLKKSLNSGAADVSSFGDKLGKFGKVAGAAFAAAGAAALAYAGKALVEATKNAIADEEAQRNLALTLQNTTKATDAQIAAVESYITQVSLSKGVTDDQLRPAFERLTRSTKDTQQSQELLNIALDVAAATGKPLETVANALGKAYDGNASSLGRLGLGIDANILKSKDMDQITRALADNFGGFASEKAQTFTGKMDRLKIAFDEGKETVGSFVLDAITPMVTTFVNNVVPAVQRLAEELGPKLTPVFETLTNYMKDFVIPTFQAIWAFITDYVIPAISTFLTPIINGLRSAFEKVTGKIEENREKLAPLLELFKTIAKFIRDVYAPVVGKILGAAFDTLGTAIGIVIGLFANLVSLVNSAFNAIKNIVNFIKNNPVTQAIGGAIDTVFGGGRANGGPVSRGTSYLVGERGPEIFTPRSNGSIIPNGAMGGGTVINLNVTGAIDSEGTARTIINALNDSFYRGTGGAGQLVTS